MCWIYYYYSKYYYTIHIIAKLLGRDKREFQSTDDNPNTVLDICIVFFKNLRHAPMIRNNMIGWDALFINNCILLWLFIFVITFQY